MQKYHSGLLFVALVCLLNSCAGTSGERNRPLSTSRDIITQKELAMQTVAYDAIQSLRPTWLRPRGTDSIRNPSQVWVYRDGSRLGGVEILRNMSTADIAEIRFYDAAAATQRWGMGHGAGVISITTRSR
jgi:hypothetical protein